MEVLYRWVEQLAVYMVLVTAVMQMLPGGEYRKYVRFFTGLLLIVILFGPILRLAKMEQTFGEIFESRTYEAELRELESRAKELEEMEMEEYRKDE